MDAKEYDRIADLLLQIRKKYDNLLLLDANDQFNRMLLIKMLDQVIMMNDKFAQWDAKGWL